MKNLLYICFILFSLSSFNIVAQDTDGDGVIDEQEVIDGTDLNNPCDYIVVSIIEENIAGMDCDGDGVLDETEILNGTNPFDLCDFYFEDITVNTLAVWDEEDCDGDGIVNIDEMFFGTNMQDLCDYPEYQEHYFPFDNIGNINYGEWGEIDCDGDGVLNENEYIDNTNTLDCDDFLYASVSTNPTDCLDNFNSISGIVLFDDEGNNCESGSTPVNNFLLKINSVSANYTTNTNNLGNYSFYTADGDFTTSFLTILPDYFSVDPLSQSSNFTGYDNNDIINFCISSSQDINDLTISFYPLSDARPGFDVSYVVVFQNLGTNVMNGQIELEYDNTKLNFLNSSIATTSQTASSLFFDYNNLNVLENRSIVLDFNVYEPPTVEIDDILSFTATINPIVGDNTLSDNSFIFNQIVIGSYDPNDIHVVEGSSIFVDEIENYLHYIIRFQNTGNAEAINVCVENMLSDLLDWNTFQLEYSSHDVVVQIENNNDVRFVYNDIMLPDNTTDELGSHGYIAYKIKPLIGIEIGNIVSSVANIFFDYNPAVITNTVATEVIDNLSVNDVAIISDQVNFYPIPVKNQITITSQLSIVNVDIVNTLGEKVLSFYDYRGLQLLDLSVLPLGIYFCKIADNKGNIGVKKILKGEL